MSMKQFTFKSKCAILLEWRYWTPSRICLINWVASSSLRDSFWAKKSNSSPPETLQAHRSTVTVSSDNRKQGHSTALSQGGGCSSPGFLRYVCLWQRLTSILGVTSTSFLMIFSCSSTKFFEIWGNISSVNLTGQFSFVLIRPSTFPGPRCTQLGALWGTKQWNIWTSGTSHEAASVSSSYELTETWTPAFGVSGLCFFSKRRFVFSGSLHWPF